MIQKILIFLLVVIWGCTPSFHLDCLPNIENAPCVPGVYECYQKSREASKCFRKHGFNAIPVCGPVKGLERHHCWVEIKHEGEVYWYDPTWVKQDVRYGCWKKSQYFDRKIFQAN